MLVKQINTAFRNSNKDDVPFLYEMLFEAIHWNSITDRPILSDFFKNPEFNKLLADWGREGDIAIIAELNIEAVGAAWYRFWTDANHSYGYIDSQIPEIAMAIKYGHRSKGIGRSLLRTLKNIAQSKSIS